MTGPVVQDELVLVLIKSGRKNSKELLLFPQPVTIQYVILASGYDEYHGVFTYMLFDRPLYPCKARQLVNMGRTNCGHRKKREAGKPTKADRQPALE